MDLLDSILGSMDKPPSLSEKEKEKAKGTCQYKELSQGRRELSVFLFFCCLVRVESKERQGRGRAEKLAEQV